MSSSRLPASTCIFRSQSWGNAWLDVWGQDTRLQLIDMGGRKNPREMLYRVAGRLKNILPIYSLNLVGVGSRVISTPRAEYNDFCELVTAAGSVSDLIIELKKISWSQLYLPDLNVTAQIDQVLLQFSSDKHWLLHELGTEPAYYVNEKNFSAYLSALGANTRLAYFNRRERLHQAGDIEFVRYPFNDAMVFFKILNEFHLVRWGTPCYSVESQNFLNNFMERLNDEGGVAILEAMQVNGETVSVLFDIELRGCRYNFQSGYLENKFPKVALGALHMGYAIQAAIESGLIYDFMAGEGKNTNYKARIATHQQLIKGVSVERGIVKHLRQLKKVVISR